MDLRIIDHLLQAARALEQMRDELTNAYVIVGDAIDRNGGADGWAELRSNIEAMRVTVYGDGFEKELNSLIKEAARLA